MPARRKLIDVTKLPKSAELVAMESEAMIASAKESLGRQQKFMEDAGMDRQKLREFINGDRWSQKQKHKARQELLRLSEELKAEMAHDVSVKRKEIRLAARLLSAKQAQQQSRKPRRRRTGFI